MSLSRIIHENESGIWLKLPNKFGGQSVVIPWSDENRVIPFDANPRKLIDEVFCSEEQYLRLVSKAIEEMNSGEIQKIVTSRKFEVGYTLAPPMGIVDGRFARIIAASKKHCISNDGFGRFQTVRGLVRLDF
jgi:hypothetical protein